MSRWRGTGAGRRTGVGLSEAGQGERERETRRASALCCLSRSSNVKAANQSSRPPMSTPNRSLSRARETQGRFHTVQRFTTSCNRPIGIAMERDNSTVGFVPTSSLFAVIQHSFWLQTIITVFVVCACTRILSSHWFKSVKHATGRHISPPTLPYWIPFFRHAFSMGWDSQKFTAQCLYVLCHFHLCACPEFDILQERNKAMAHPSSSTRLGTKF